MLHLKMVLRREKEDQRVIRDALNVVLHDGNVERVKCHALLLCRLCRNPASFLLDLWKGRDVANRA
jgi:hypothetical protein